MSTYFTVENLRAALSGHPAD